MPLVRLCVSLVGLTMMLAACSFDPDEAAPYAEPAVVAGACGTTESLFPRLLAFVRSGQMEPLREIIESRLVPGPGEAQPDPSIRNVFQALVRIVTRLGIEKTVRTASAAAGLQTAEVFSDVLVESLRFTTGELDGVDHYDAAEAAGFFIRRCDSKYVLRSAEELLRFESPSRGGLWLSAVLEEANTLLDDPQIDTILRDLERDSAMGRPAMVSLLNQVMSFMADDEFDVARVQALVDAAIDPLVDDAMEARIDSLLNLLTEATVPTVGILEPLQEAMRCGMRHEAPRKELLGFAYDLVASDALELHDLLSQASELTTLEQEEAFLVEAADLFRIIREEERARDDIFEVIAILLTRPEVERTMPVMIEIFSQGVADELFDAVTLLLSECEEEQASRP